MWKQKPDAAPVMSGRKSGCDCALTPSPRPRPRPGQQPVRGAGCGERGPEGRRGLCGQRHPGPDICRPSPARRSLKGHVAVGEEKPPPAEKETAQRGAFPLAAPRAQQAWRPQALAIVTPPSPDTCHRQRRGGAFRKRHFKRATHF